jgi:hypothetical protein
MKLKAQFCIFKEKSKLLETEVAGYNLQKALREDSVKQKIS